MSDEVPRIRRKPLPEDALLVIRGWDERVAGLILDARRFRARFPGWDRFGLSAFACVDADQVDSLCEARLQQYATVRVFHRNALERNGIEVVPTFRSPHVTLAHERLDVLLFALRQSDREDIPNRYHKEAW